MQFWQRIVELLESDAYSMRNYAMLYDEPSLIEAHARAGIVDAAYDGRLWVRCYQNVCRWSARLARGRFARTL